MRSRIGFTLRITGVTLAFAWLAGCTVPGRDTEAIREQRVDVVLNKANFDVLSVNNVGRAYQEWALLVFYVGGDDEPLTKAWSEMKADSGAEGRAAEFVNVTIDRARETVIWPIFSRTVWTVSADAIAFREDSK